VPLTGSGANLQVGDAPATCYDPGMGKFDRITAALEALPEARREEIVADLRERLADPGPVTSDEEVEAFFERLTA